MLGNAAVSLLVSNRHACIFFYSDGIRAREPDMKIDLKPAALYIHMTKSMWTPGHDMPLLLVSLCCSKLLDACLLERLSSRFWLIHELRQEVK